MKVFFFYFRLNSIAFCGSDTLYCYETRGLLGLNNNPFLSLSYLAHQVPLASKLQSDARTHISKYVCLYMNHDALALFCSMA